MRRVVGLACICVCLVLSSVIRPLTATADTTSSSAPLAPLLLTEIQTGGCGSGDQTSCTEDGKMEFVELYNSQASTLQLDGWQLQYLSASGATTTALVTFHGSVAPNGSVLLAHDGYYAGDADASFGVGDTKSSGMLAKTGGSLRVVDDTGTQIDLLGWGSATQFESKAAKAPNPGQSLQRGKDVNGAYVDTTNNAQDFGLGTPAPLGGDYTPAPSVGSDPTPSSGDNQGGTDGATIPTCEGVVITELLPNPSGADSGQEFIELYNPTDRTISLQGCSLQTTGNSVHYTFAAGMVLAESEYKAFYNQETGLTLPNTAGGTVWLLSPTDELQVITYPGDLADDVAWARFGDVWQPTFTPTPGATNALLSEMPCLAGQERNADTNRCRDVATASAGTAVVPCKPGQERNPETNRCRAIAATSAVQACKPGQERNPATNRCRSVLAASTTLKPCPMGQERNSDTNRCRKVTAANVASVRDIATASNPSAVKAYWLLAILAVAAAGAYGIYEWRQELWLYFDKAKSRVMRFVPRWSR